MSKVPSLIPKAGDWMDKNFNVMLVGLHGVGKTQAVLDTCREKGLRLKYFSCSTLDPYTDLVGVPHVRKDEDGEEYLKMIRPREVDDAEIIFMDEFNRADAKVHNALMEIILFRSINGDPLPNLRMIWAAMNPPGGQYDVEELDPALIDRFDVFEDVGAKLGTLPAYLVSKGIRQSVADAVVAWATAQDRARRNQDEIITPRRLEKICHVYEETGDFKHAIPNWFKCDRGKLRQMLKEVEVKASTSKAGSASSGPSNQFDYNPEYFASNAVEIAEYLRNNPTDHETHRAAREVIQSRQAPRMVRDYSFILDAMVPAVLEGMLADMAAAKFGRLQHELELMPPDWADAVERFKAAVAKEAEGRS